MSVQSWLLPRAGVLYRTFCLILLCIYKRIVFFLDPEARVKDLEAVTASYELHEDGLKYLKWRNAHTVSKFFYTHRMVHDYFVTQMQDINKSARLHEAAPNPNLYHAKTGEMLPMLSVATSGSPLVVNFGSCT